MRRSKASTTWHLADVIDFEFLLEQDREIPAPELANRDREIVKNLPQNNSDSTGNRRSLFRNWLEVRRTTIGRTEEPPGRISIDAWRVLLKLIALLGGVLGALAAAQLLRYDGQQPVNVAAYLGWLVLFQVALAGLTIVVLLLRKTNVLSTESSLLLSVVQNIWARMIKKVSKHANAHVTGETRTNAAAFVGTTAGYKRIYGDAVVWPLVGSLQMFGVCFNIAALATTVALVIFSDRAFGWQSAVNFSPEQIHQLTQTMAAPWRWALPDSAPTLDQIEGSKIILKNGIKQLTTSDLVSWWPFLCMSLAIYGLLPRLLLWSITSIAGRKALQNLSFNHASCDRLYERLKRPSLETSGEGNEDTNSPIPNQTSKDRTPDSTSSNPVENTIAAVLMNDELRANVDTENLTKIVRDRFCLETSKIIAWSNDSESINKAVNDLQSTDWTNEQIVVLLLEEAWQPPIAEKIESIRELRTVLGGEAKLVVVLLGLPANGNSLTSPKLSDLSVWDRQIQALGDTHLRVEALIENE